ncbi:related to pheromone response factor Prf1 [Melanopsichium pennsylvanicum]|uniref:Related to pheromone response factor Prf1 n=2 Tax=Melanopsichium pennsylvanicum TaxID=63383 RepID=A0AAJ4XLD9_9BASI|nr:pheromone response factor Prf1 [Melanopsichium pennsylvanicum 4]SNX84442.1 related to pheromone response factor Prf1 [Melanopsichium pennsylvanicum]
MRGLASAIEGRDHDHASVNFFDGWSTNVELAGSSAQHDAQIKRSLSQEEATAPLFQSISFPKKDATLAASLFTGFEDDDAEEMERIQNLPPSKRPGVSHAKKTPPNHIKRPRNAYIIFRSHTVSQKLIPKEVEHDHRNISRIIAHMWKSLSPEERAHYERIAREEKERHKQLHPDYRYQPTTRRNAVCKRKVKKLENGEDECQEIADIILKAQGKEGVVVRSGSAKAAKRTREATRPAENEKTPRKRAKVIKSPRVEPIAADQMLETVFLHPSPSSSPSSKAGTEAMAVPSPESFRLTSPSIEQGQALRAEVEQASERRASPVPILPPCSPPPPFELPCFEVQLGDGPLDRQESLTSEVLSAAMPAPTWKSRRAQPPPIPNTWQLGSYDDQSLPSPRSFDLNRNATTRPRTAFPSTPSSGSFRGFFHPWAYEYGNESMLISPMNASFQDMRRRSSLARSGSVAGRRIGSFDSESNARVEDARALVTSDSRMADVELFDPTARAAGLEVSAGELPQSDTSFAFDPLLEGEGCEPAPLLPQALRSDLHNSATCPRRSSSPRPSFSGSTLAVAARDWASIKRRRSKMGHPTSDSLVAPSSEEHDQREAEKTTQIRSSLETSVERAVLLALGKDADSERGERNSRIVQQILCSLNAELSLQQPLASESEHTHRRASASKAVSPAVERRTSLRGSCGSAPFRSTQYYAGNMVSSDGQRAANSFTRATRPVDA